MYHRIEVEFKFNSADVLGVIKRNDIENFLNIKVNSVRTRKIYTIDAELSKEELKLIKRKLFVDPITQQANAALPVFDWLIEVGYRPGVTDNVGRTSNTAIRDLINRDLKEDEGVYTSTQYLLEDTGLEYKDVEKIARELLANELVERWIILSYDDFRGKA